MAGAFLLKEGKEENHEGGQGKRKDAETVPFQILFGIFAFAVKNSS
jgi:hypothetical protein